MHLLGSPHTEIAAYSLLRNISRWEQLGWKGTEKSYFESYARQNSGLEAKARKLGPRGLLLALPLTCCVASGRSLNLSGAIFPPLKKGGVQGAESPEQSLIRTRFQVPRQRHYRPAKCFILLVLTVFKVTGWEMASVFSLASRRQRYFKIEAEVWAGGSGAGLGFRSRLCH